MKRVNQAVGGVAGDDVDLSVDERAVDQAEIHDAGLGREAQAVAFAPAAKTVRALKKFVAYANAPTRGDRSEIGIVVQTELLGIIAADDHGEGVLEAEGLGDFEIE